MSESARFFFSQSDFSVKVKDQTMRGRQMDKTAGKGRERIPSTTSKGIQSGTQIGSQTKVKGISTYEDVIFTQLDFHLEVKGFCV